MSENHEKLDPVAETLLTLVTARGSGKSICPSDAARAFAETKRKKSDPTDLWRRYLPAVRQQALHLARQGRIDILRRGARQDPRKPIKGVIRLTLPGWAPEAAPRKSGDDVGADGEAFEGGCEPLDDVTDDRTSEEGKGS
ncbi:DUF3253 domain-containing protein [Algihabitans albus]|uniref:DUF3253 domain-containing protein n=1 Tax=Algihabitans albus TaxID=2164067 RepID=UPI000E5D3F5F|nr:DUF3253 domain-containing protein [Algihabitans albus]